MDLHDVDTDFRILTPAKLNELVIDADAQGFSGTRPLPWILEAVGDDALLWLRAVLLEPSPTLCLRCLVIVARPKIPLFQFLLDINPEAFGFLTIADEGAKLALYEQAVTEIRYAVPAAPSPLSDSDDSVNVSGV